MTYQPIDPPPYEDPMDKYLRRELEEPGRFETVEGAYTEQDEPVSIDRDLDAPVQEVELCIDCMQPLDAADPKGCACWMKYV